MSVYYNENDKFAAAWLRELIKEGLIADGEVDERDIQDVQSADVRGFVQCHWFAGIGGWSLALRMARWDDARPVWTGSCPCQGYSAAGQNKGATDARNLWPDWFRLIQERRPVVVFGEQVENAIGHGWLDAVSTNMEAEDYALGAVVLGAHSVKAPHRRQRLYWVAHTTGDGLEEQRLPAQGRSMVADATGGGGLREDAGSIPDAALESEREPTETHHAVANGRDSRIESCGSGESVADADSKSTLWPPIARTERNPWRVEPELGRVAHGVPHKLVEPYLRGFGNAIVPQVAQAFIESYLEVIEP